MTTFTTFTIIMNPKTMEIFSESGYQYWSTPLKDVVCFKNDDWYNNGIQNGYFVCANVKADNYIEAVKIAQPYFADLLRKEIEKKREKIRRIEQEIVGLEKKIDLLLQ